MPRPSRNMDRLLLESGKKLLPKTGFSGLNIRAVAKDAGVNLGMFNYHFKTKENFLETLLKELYEEFFNNFILEAHTGATSKERLKNVIVTAALFIKNHRQLLAPFIEEIIKGNNKIAAFAKDNMTKHIFILIKLIKDCQKDGYIVKLPLLNVLPPIMGCVVGPIAVATALGKYFNTGILPRFINAAISTQVLSDKAIVQRIDIILKGLEPAK